MKSLYSYTLNFLIAAFFCSIIYFVQNDEDIIYIDNDKAEQDLYYIPDGDYLKYLNGGWNETIADYFWIQNVLYFGKRGSEEDLHFVRYKLGVEVDVSNLDKEIESNKIRFKYMNKFLNTLTDLDPYFEFPYYFGGLFLSLKTDRSDQAMELLDKGVKYLPDRWSLPFAQGFNYYFFQGEEELAADYFMKAGVLPGCPEQVISLAKSILIQKGKTEIAKEFLLSVIENTKDPIIKSEMSEVLKNLKK